MATFQLKIKLLQKKLYENTPLKIKNTSFLENNLRRVKIELNGKIIKLENFSFYEH